MRLGVLLIPIPPNSTGASFSAWLGMPLLRTLVFPKGGASPTVGLLIVSLPYHVLLKFLVLRFHASRTMSRPGETPFSTNVPPA